MLREVGADVGCGCWICRVPEKRLTESLDGLRVVGMTLEVLAAFGASLGIVGKDAAKGDLIARVVGVLHGECAETGDGVRTAFGGSRFGFVVCERPLA